MPRGRRRKIEVPTDTQPHFGLGDTAEDIERGRRKREERDEREEMDRERMEREEGIEPGRGENYEGLTSQGIRATASPPSKK